MTAQHARPEYRITARWLSEHLADPGDQTIVPYCQHAYRSANTWPALTLLGYPHVRNYLGSWDEWGNHADLPIATAARLH
jgi:3-mercaptopyruvate sulfurtransferase SseA